MRVHDRIRDRALDPLSVRVVALEVGITVIPERLPDPVESLLTYRVLFANRRVRLLKMCEEG